MKQSFVVQKVLRLRRRKKRDAELLVYHKSQNTHHGRTALVNLDTSLDKFGLVIECVPTEINEVVTEISGKLSSCNVLHHKNLCISDKSVL